HGWWGRPATRGGTKAGIRGGAVRWQKGYGAGERRAGHTAAIPALRWTVLARGAGRAAVPEWARARGTGGVVAARGDAPAAAHRARVGRARGVMGSELSGRPGRRQVRGVGDGDDSGAVVASRQCGRPAGCGVHRAGPTRAQADGLRVRGRAGPDAGRRDRVAARRTGGWRDARIPALRSSVRRTRLAGHERSVPARERSLHAGADGARRPAVARLRGTVAARAQSRARAGVVHVEALPR